MQLNAQIVVDHDIDNIKELFEPEEKEFSNKRASYTVEKKDKRLFFRIQASDSSALRAVLNSITKLLSVYESSKKICKK